MTEIGKNLTGDYFIVLSFCVFSAQTKPEERFENANISSITHREITYNREIP